MAIDLPPAIPPQLVPLSQMESLNTGYQLVTGSVDGYEVRVSGEHYLSETELRDILDRARNPSQAILLITAATNRAGNLLVTSYYATQDNTVHVHAMQSSVAKLEGPSAITSYFAGLEDEPALKRKQFDRARVMANIRSERTGVDYTVSQKMAGSAPGQSSLVFTENPREDYKPWDAFLQLGNQGSRFASRYLADVGAGYNFATGTRLSAGYQHAFPELGESRGTEDYQQFQLRLDHPFRWGLYGVDASRVDYTRELGPFATTATSCSLALGDLCLATTSSTGTTFFDLDATIDRYGLSGEQVLSSDLHYRFNLFQRIEHIDSDIKASGGLGTVQDEVYTTLELGARYQQLHSVGDQQRLQWGVRASVKGGLSSDSGTLGTDDTSPGVAVGKRTAEFITVLPQATLKYLFTEQASLHGKFRAQIADEQLPQQQQWVLGGIDTISAYVPGVLVGDNGYFARGSFDYRWDLGWTQLTGSLFAEYGASSYENARRDPTLDIGMDPGSTSSIVDAGVGVKAEFGDTFEVRAVAAESLREKNVSDAILERTSADFFVVLKASF